MASGIALDENSIGLLGAYICGWSSGMVIHSLL